MVNQLQPCPNCDRHVRVSEAACPFCKAVLPNELVARAVPTSPSRRLSRAALFALGTLTTTAVACGGSTGTSDEGAGSGGGGADNGSGASGGVASPVYGAPAVGGTGGEGSGGTESAAGAAGEGSGGNSPFGGTGGVNNGSGGTPVPVYGAPPSER